MLVFLKHSVVSSAPKIDELDADVPHISLHSFFFLIYVASHSRNGYYISLDIGVVIKSRRTSKRDILRESPQSESRISLRIYIILRILFRVIKVCSCSQRDELVLYNLKSGREGSEGKTCNFRSNSGS